MASMGAITPEQLTDGLRMQVHRKLMRLFALSDVNFQLFSGDHDHGLVGESAPVRADPYYVIYHGVRSFYDAERLKTQMAKIEGSALSLSAAFAQTKPRFMMGADVEGLVTLLGRSTLPVEDVRNVSDLGPLETDMLLYSLYVTEMLDVDAAVKKSGPAAYAGDAAQIAPVIVGQGSAESAESGDDYLLPSAKSAENELTPIPIATSEMDRRQKSSKIEPLPVMEEDEEDLPDSIMAAASVDNRTSMVGKTKAAAALRREIVEKFNGLEDSNHYDVLGLTQACTPDQVREAYFQLAKVFHPDRASALGLNDVVDQAEEIFTRVSEAHNILAEDETREEYNEKLEGRDVKADVLSAVEAEFIFQKGVFHLRKKDYKQALRHFEEAYKLNAMEGEHLAYMAWTIYSDPARDRFRTWDTIMEQMEKSLTISPNSSTCHYFMGELHAAKGNDRKAVEFFNKTLEINPDHLEAERHLRLIKIRQDKQQSTAGKGVGFLSRLLKKDGEEDDKKKKKKKGFKKKSGGKNWY